MTLTGEPTEGGTRERKHSTLSHKGRLDWDMKDILFSTFEYSEMIVGLYINRRVFEGLTEY